MQTGLIRPTKFIGIAVILVAIFFCCPFLYFSFISFPSTETIARDYLNAVISENLESAVKLARSKEYCQKNVREVAIQDIRQFGGARIRNVKIETRYNTGSDDELQFAFVEFEYQKLGQSDWQLGKMVLPTDHDVPGFRYLCGNTLRNR